MQYINTGELPDDRNKAQKVQIQLARLSLVNRQLFKRSLDGPYLKFLTTEQGHYVLAELHEGICGNHPCGIIVVHRILKVSESFGHGPDSKNLQNKQGTGGGVPTGSPMLKLER